jgi:putative FmdB family regulatory protein
LPTYEYHCDSCDRNFDAVQSFHDEPLEACPTCGSPVKKVFGSVGIVFKGSGFYKNDSRTAAKAGEGASAVGAGADGAGADGAKSDGAKSDGAGPDKGEGGSRSGDSSAPVAPPAKKESNPTPAATSSSGNGSSRTAKESAKT